MLSKRNIFASFINQSKPTEYSFTLHLSQHLITKSTSMPPPRTLFSFCRGCHEQALYETETHHLNCNILCRIRKQKTLRENLHLQWNWLQGHVQKGKIGADSQRKMQEKVKHCARVTQNQVVAHSKQLDTQQDHL